jgi:hypothetical protein
MKNPDSIDIKIQKFLESRNITDLSKIVLVHLSDSMGIEVYQNGIQIGVIR